MYVVKENITVVNVVLDPDDLVLLTAKSCLSKYTYLEDTNYNKTKVEINVRLDINEDDAE